MEKNKDWENLRKSCLGSVYQSLDWARAKESDGKASIFLRYDLDGILKAGILAFEQKISTPLGKKKIIVAEGTPLALDNESLSVILQKFMLESKKYWYGAINPTLINPKTDFFSNSDYKKVSNNTILIDLRKTEPELFQSLEKKSARWGVKTAEKNLLEFREAQTKEEIEELFDLYKRTAESGGFSGKSLAFLMSLWENKDISRVFLISHENKIVAGGVILIDKDYTILNITASSEEGNKLQAMPFLYWSLIKYSKQINKTYFDLGGYDLNAKKGEKIYNVNKFKEGFGGSIMEQPIYSTNWKYPLVRRVMKNLKTIKKLYKKQ